jgi:integrase
MKTPRSRSVSSSGNSANHPLGDEPLLIKEGSVEVKIYPTWNKSRRVDPATGRAEEHRIPQFTLSYYEANRRILKKFTTLDKARAEADFTLVKLANGELEALKLTGRDRNIYLAATSELAKLGADLHLDMVIKDYVSAMKVLAPLNVTLAQAVHEYAVRHKSVRESRSVGDLVAEFIGVKEKAGKSERYLGDLARLNKFADAFQIPVQQVRGEELQIFIEGLGTPRTQVNYWRLVKSLLRFAVRRKYAPRDLLDELEGVELPDLAPTNTEVFTPDELREMLDAARPALVPWLAVAAFAGVRSAEILRLDWSEVNLARKLVTVRPEKAKTVSRRTVPLCDAAIAWLKPHAQQVGRVACYTEENKFVAAVVSDVNAARRKAGNAKPFRWKRNGLRHSFCSYRLALVKNAHEVSLEAGNSPNMIFKHYRELVSAEDGQAWFAISPHHDPSNILPLRVTA